MPNPTTTAARKQIGYIVRPPSVRRLILANQHVRIISAAQSKNRLFYLPFPINFRAATYTLGQCGGVLCL